MLVNLGFLIWKSLRKEKRLILGIIKANCKYFTLKKNKKTTHCKNENVNTGTIHTVIIRYSQLLIVVAFWSSKPFSPCLQASDWVDLPNTIRA